MKVKLTLVSMMSRTQMHVRRVYENMRNAKKHDNLHYHYKRVNKNEKEMGIGRHTRYYIFALIQEGPNECPSVRIKLTITKLNE